MAMCARLWLAVVLLLACAAGPLHAQVRALEDPPAPYVPQKPLTRANLDRREALTLYAQALLREHEDRLLEAARLFEQARDLDPEAAYVHKALVPLYLALCRSDDALAACRKVLDLDPGDFQTWYLYARQLKDQGRADDALAAFARGVACAGIKEHPDLAVEMHYDQGILYEEAHDYVRAEAAFREVTRVLDRPDTLLEAGRFDPEQIKVEAARTYESIGRVCTESHRYDEAAAAYRKACALDPERLGRLNYNLARVCVAEGKTAEALAALDDYLRTVPQTIDAYELKVTLLKQLGRAGEVMPAMRGYAERDAHNIALHLLLARECGRADRIGDAESIYRKLAEDSPVPEVYRGLFGLYRDRGRMADVLRLFDSAIRNAAGSRDKPGDREAAAQSRAMLAVLRDDVELGKALVASAYEAIGNGRRLQPQTSSFLAVLATRAHQLPEAERFYRQCLENPFPSPETEGLVYGGLIRILWEERKIRDVEAVCRQGLERSQRMKPFFFHYHLARSLAQQDRADEAVTQADDAVKLADDDDRLTCREMRVEIFSLVGRHDPAVAECQAMLKEYTKPGEQRDIRYTLAGVYSEAHDYAHSEQELRRLLKENPNDIAALNDLGYTMADQGRNLDEAEQMIRRAIDLDRQEKRAGKSVSADAVDDNFMYVDSLGWVLFRRGRLQEARTWLEKAVALDDGGKDPTILDHLGDVYARLDEPARARECWQKAVNLYEKEKRRRPDDHYEEMKRKLKLLDSQTHP